ncbi:MAG: hypothetical protein IPI24_14150 [Ignavibacteria bacterium]|nr:hypothetical protein [Ignavibacteria bacterium]
MAKNELTLDVTNFTKGVKTALDLTADLNEAVEPIDLSVNTDEVAKLGKVFDFGRCT